MIYKFAEIFGILLFKKVRRRNGNAIYINADGKFSLDKEQAIKMLAKGEIKVVFSVDMAMFLRPTESPIPF